MFRYAATLDFQTRCLLPRHSWSRGWDSLPGQPGLPVLALPRVTPVFLTSALPRGAANYTVESNLLYSAASGFWDFYVITSILYELGTSHYTLIHTVNFASALALTRLTSYIFERKAHYTNWEVHEYNHTQLCLTICIYFLAQIYQS